MSGGEAGQDRSRKVRMETSLISYLIVFTLGACGFLFVTLVIGKLLRPTAPNPEKLAIYECGEPTIGTSWVQFDLRFYVVALLFVIFDVELAFFFPWAVVFGRATALADPRIAAVSATENGPGAAQTQAKLTAALTGQSVQEAAKNAIQPETARRLAWLALVDIAVFFGVLLVGFVYLWKQGDIDWVRATTAERGETTGLSPPEPPRAVEAVGAGRR